MIDKRYIELINRKIDRELSDAEESQLAAYLASNPDARDLYLRLSGLTDSLEQLPDCDPPRDLKHEILAAVRHSGSGKVARAGVFTRCLNAFSAMGRMRYGITFATGIVVGAVIWSLSPIGWHSRESLTPWDVSGTIIGRTDMPASQRIEDREFHAAGLDGRISVEAVAGTAVVQLHVVSDRAVSITFEFDPSALTFRGFRYLNAEPTSLDISPGVVRVAHSGQNDYRFAFDEGARPTDSLIFRVHADRLLYEDVVNMRVRGSQ